MPYSAGVHPIAIGKSVQKTGLPYNNSLYPNWPLDQHYTVAAAATAMNVGKSTMDKWVRQLKEERAGKSPTASPMTPEQIEIRELKKRLQRVEMERDILKNATETLMSDSLNNSH
jgi:transposase